MSDNLQRILEEINAYAEKTSAGILSESRSKAETLISDTRSKVSGMMSEAENFTEKESETIRAQAQNGYEKTRRSKILSAKREMLENVYDKALEKLSELTPSEKTALYRKWISSYAEDRAYTIVLSAGESAEVVNAIKINAFDGFFTGHPTVSATDESMRGGVKLDFGDLLINMSFETLVEEQKGRYDAEILTVLFGNSEII